MRPSTSTGGTRDPRARVAIAMLVTAMWSAGCERAAETAPAAAPLDEVPTPELIDQLLTGGGSRNRAALAGAIAKRGNEAMTQFVDAFAGMLREPLTPQNLDGLVSALHLVGDTKDRLWIPFVRRIHQRCDGTDGLLADHALAARARLGDERSASQIADGWRRRLRRSILLDRLAKVTGGQSRALTLMRQRNSASTNRARDAFRHVSETARLETLGRLTQRYWEAWSWLGERDGAVFAEALYDLARPPAAADRLRTQTAQRALEAAGAILAVDSAAAILECVRAQSSEFNAADSRLVARIMRDIPRADAARRQRAAWALARALGLSFPDGKQRPMPCSLTHDDIEHVMHEAGRTETDPVPLPQATGRARTPLALQRRIITRARLLEHRLIAAVNDGSMRVDEAFEHWTEMRIGWTDRADALLADSNERALGAAALAMAVACEYGAHESQTRLERWSRSASAPLCFRELAMLAVASLQAQRGEPVTGWPTRINECIGANEVGLIVPARMLAAGGPAMIDDFARASTEDRAAPPALVRAARLETERHRPMVD